MEKKTKNICKIFVLLEKNCHSIQHTTKKKLKTKKKKKKHKHHINKTKPKKPKKQFQKLGRKNCQRTFNAILYCTTMLVLYIL